MCYSLSLFSNIQVLIKRFGASPAPSFSLTKGFYVSAFTYPTWPIIANERPNIIQGFRWGLIPNWVTDEQKAEAIRLKTLNARYETLLQRSAFRQAIRRRRCLVLVDGFFEFRAVGGKKYPYFIHKRDTGPFALAGIWEVWKNPRSGKEERTFSIITVPANTMLSRIHNTKKRMPLILLPEVEHEWLVRPLKAPEVREVTGRLDDTILHAYPVSRTIILRDVDRSRIEILDRTDYPELEREG